MAEIPSLMDSGAGGKEPYHEGIRQVRARYCRFSGDWGCIVCEQFCRYGLCVDPHGGLEPERNWSRRRSHGRWRRIRNLLHVGSRWASACSLQILATPNAKLGTALIFRGFE